MSAVPSDLRALVAIDLGAESCRVSLLRWINGSPEMMLVHRFANGPQHRNNSLRWDLGRIEAGVQLGLRCAAEAAPEGIRSIAVDGWAVDYVRLSKKLKPLEDPFCYRDVRTVLAEAALNERISVDRMKKITAIQPMRINTLYQMYADRMENLEPGRWLNLPEYLLYSLGGQAVSELSNASHTQMLDAMNEEWSSEIMKAADLDRDLAPRLVRSGTIVGKLECPLTDLAPFRDTHLIAPACHDTASAIAGIPASGEDWAYISSGTWSLVGTLLKSPILSDAAAKEGFTNLAAVGGAVCFHVNVNGMWMLSQCMLEWREGGKDWELGELLNAAEALPPPDGFIDVDHPSLLLPGDMPARINARLEHGGTSALPLDDHPAFAAVIVYSLAERYRQILSAVSVHTGKELKRVFIVGGGSRNDFLNRMIARSTGLEVIRGSSESATVGNFAVQLAAIQTEGEEGTGADAEQIAKWTALLSTIPIMGIRHCQAGISADPGGTLR